MRKQRRSRDAIVHEAPEIQVINRSSLLTDLAKSLATGLVSGVAGKIGVLIFNEIFPPGIPSYFDEVYIQIQQIVNKELTQSTIDEINGQINGMTNWVSVTYTNAKESGMTNQQLTDLMQPREPQIAIQLVGVLMEQRYAEPGICVFMIGAGMHLSILQELALVDPNFAPNSSPYAKSVQDYATTYSDFAKKTTNSIINTRGGKIQAKSEWYNNGYAFYNFYWFEDAQTGYKSQDWTNIVDSKGESNPQARQQRDEAMAKYKQDVLDKLTADMSDPLATANEWLKLVGQPIPS